MSRIAIAAVLAALLLFPACSRILGDEDEDVQPIDRETIDRVVEEILVRLKARAEEMGPRFPVALPELKDAAAQHENFENFEAFRKRVHKTDPALVIEISRRITDRIRELLETDEPE